MGSNKDDEFNVVLTSAVSEVLDFGDVVLNFLELNSSFRRGSMVDGADSLSSGLRELFGDSGAVIEDMIAKRVYDRLSLPEKQNGSFEERIRFAYGCFKGGKGKRPR